ncbi:MAG: response regulator transcription factor [Bacteroidota bacterium]
MIIPQQKDANGSLVRRIRVLVIDRHPAIGDAFSSLLKHTEDMIFCGQATTASEAYDHITIAKPDVVIISLSLDDAYGLDLCMQLVAQLPNLHILIFSQYDEKIFAERAIEAGAMGYIMKRMNMQDVLEGIRSVMRNETFLSTSMTARLLNKITKGAAAVKTEAMDLLTHRELAVLLMMGEGASPQDMADRLKLDRKTVETHRRRVKEKLNFESVSALLHFATQWRHAQGTLTPHESGTDTQTTIKVHKPVISPS